MNAIYPRTRPSPSLISPLILHSSLFLSQNVGRRGKRGTHTESQHLLDAVVVGDKHDHAVDTHTPSSSGRETVLQAGAEVLVDELGLVVALVLLARLLLEAEALVEGVVQLGVGVDNLLLADEGLETFAEADLVAVVLGERRHHLRVAVDEGRVDALLLDEFSDELGGKEWLAICMKKALQKGINLRKYLVKQAGIGLRRSALNLLLGANLLQELVGLLGVELVSRRKLLSGRLLEGGNHLNSLPRSLPVDIVDLATLGVELGLVATGNLLDHAGHELLGDLHEIVDIRIGPVELASGELRVVGQINALITELTANLVYTVKTTDNQHLEVELGRNTHKEVHVELVVMSHEGLRCCSTGNSVHHRGLNLDEVALIKVLANIADNLTASQEDVPAAVVHDQVEVTLTITGLLVLQSIVHVRQHAETRRQQDDFLRENGKFSLIVFGLGVGPSRETNDSDNVTTAEMLVLRHVVTNSLLGLSHDLDLGSLRLDVIEAQLLARLAIRMNPSSDTDFDVLLGLALLQGSVLFNDVRNPVDDVELVRVRVGRLGLTEFVNGP